MSRRKGQTMQPTLPRFTLLLALCLLLAEAAGAADIFLRVRVLHPAGERFRVTTGGHRHAGEPWWFPNVTVEVAGGAWSEWLDLRAWPWHGRMNRSGGIAEWPSMKLSVTRAGAESEPLGGCTLAVQIADRPDEKRVVLDFQEKSESNTIGFLVPNPLRAHAAEFETGSQMTARHLAWAKQATKDRPITVRKLDLITSIWGHYDPGLARQALETLRLLGFNVVSGVDTSLIRAAGMRTYAQEWLYHPDPEAAAKQWREVAEGRLAREMATEEGRWKYRTMAHYVLSDEVSVLNFRGVDAGKRDGWFRDYLRARGVTDADLGRPLAEVAYPADAMYGKMLPRDAELPTRRLHYHAAKFGQWWSAKQLRHATDLIKETLPWMRTETLPTDHGFFNAWGPPHIGMSYRLLDLFELGAQRSVDQLSAEDWLGLNHMYGPNYTWTGGQTFGYWSALLRSAIADQPITLRCLITPSDDRYLRLKAYSGLAQGAKSFFFWTFGPTYIGTENYWSDLRSEYDGIAKLHRALAKAEEIIEPARPVRDPVAVLYAVSHDLWHTDNPAAFVEKRLLWHALRHLHVQPDFLREEDVAAGRLQDYRVLYIADWCISRAASAAIDRWVRDGGVLYLSAGAATRDEFYAPYLPPFAARVWPEDAAARLRAERGHAYNERVDLPRIAPMTQVTAAAGGRRFSLPVLGCRLDLRPDTPMPFAAFADGAPAGASVRHGRGRVIAVGFLPMLAYGQGANFQPATLAEKWPAEPRELVRLPLAEAGVRPVARAGIPVVETGLLTGPNGSALILANYTYRPIRSLTVDLALPDGAAPTRAVSTEGRPVRLRKTAGGVRLELPLEGTDIVLLPR